ncbi:hypothetical protein [Enemella sp. A6]|uniref:hypothetical protein n=1 Tax=Enemella sp. A6 TaxID=3440152 RepID=UPI003EBDC2BD
MAVIRMGIADQHLATAGILDVLVLNAVHSFPIEPDVSIQVEWGLATTTVVVEADPEVAAERMQELLWRLRSPDPRDLATLIAALRDEPEPTGGLVAATVYDRFGPVGPGLMMTPHFGLARLTVAEVVRFAVRHVNAGNARLAIAAPPDFEVHVRLPEGPLRPVPSFRPRRGKYPHTMEFGLHDETIIATGHLKRTYAARALSTLWASRLNRYVRQERGISYGAKPMYLTVGTDALVGIVCDAQAGTAPDIARELRRQLDALADSGPAHGEIDREFRDLQELEPGIGWAAGEAENELLGMPLRTVDEHLADLRSITADDVRAAAAGIRRSLTVAGPGLTSDDLTDSQRITPVDITGKSYRPRPGIDQRERMVVGDGIRYHDPDHEETLSILPEQIVAAVHFEDGGVSLFRRDGARLNIEPTIWRDGPQLVADVLDMVPPRLVVPEKARPEEFIPQPPSRLRRALRPLIWAAIAIVTIVVVTAITATHIWVGSRGHDEYTGVAGLLLYTPSAIALIAALLWRNRSTR